MSKAIVIIDRKDDLKFMKDRCDEARSLGHGGCFTIGDAATLEDAFLSAVQGNPACSGVTFSRADRDSTNSEWRMRFTPVGASPDVLRNESRWMVVDHDVNVSGDFMDYDQAATRVCTLVTSKGAEVRKE
jgi:hypothetical protein